MNNGTINGMEAPRLPQIDPVTFSALNTLDTFVAKAPLTRQEHAEANKAMQHLVQTMEMLQAAVKEMNHGPSRGNVSQAANGKGAFGAMESPRVHEGTKPSDGSTIVAEAAEEIFNKAR